MRLRVARHDGAAYVDLIAVVLRTSPTTPGTGCSSTV
jgi:hypothetical protein